MGRATFLGGTMFVEDPNETGDQRRRRMAKEQESLNAAIAARDRSVEMTEADRIAMAQHANVRMNRPLDYAGIIRGREMNFDLFVGLPSDEECRKQLKKGGK
jgi:hypothetical protein